MKKLYFLFAVVLATGAVSAQKHALELGKKNKYAEFETVAKKSSKQQPKGITIWSNDFSNSAEWTYDNTSAPFLDWVITTAADTIPVTALSPALFTTVNNGFAFINSDAQGQNGSQNANMTYTGMIDCSAYLNVSLVFENSYRTYLDTRIVRVSNNGGTTWTDFIVTDGTEPTAQNTANPEITSLNVSAVAGGNDSVMIQLNYQGNWGWYWAIDDIKLVETDQYDLKLQSLQWGTDGPFGSRLAYYQVPNNQVAPVNFGGMFITLEYKIFQMRFIPQTLTPCFQDNPLLQQSLQQHKIPFGAQPPLPQQQRMRRIPCLLGLDQAKLSWI